MCLLLCGARPCGGGRSNQPPPHPHARSSARSGRRFRLCLCRAATRTFHCSFFCSAKTNPTWQGPGGSRRNARRSGAPSAKAWLSQGRRDGSRTPHSAPHSPAALCPGSVTKILVRPLGWGLPHPVSVLGSWVLVLGAGAWQERAVGHKGTFVEELHLLSSGGRCEGSPPTCLGPPGACGAPAPSPGRPAAAQAPHAAAHRQAVGLEGRLDGVLRRQPKCPGLESGGGERRRTPPSLRGGQPEAGGCRGSWGLRKASLGSSSGGMGQHKVGRGHQGGAWFVFGYSLLGFLHLSLCRRHSPGAAAACPSVLHPPVLCTHQCTAPTGALQPPLPVQPPASLPCSDQRCSGQLGTSLLDQCAPTLVCRSWDLHKAFRH